MKKEDQILADQAWDRMEEILDQQMPVKEKKRQSLLWWIGLSTLIFVSILAYVNMDVFSIQSDTNQVKANQIYVDSKEEQIKKATSERNTITDAALNSENTNSLFDEKLVISKKSERNEKRRIQIAKQNNIDKKINLASKERTNNKQVPDNLSALVTNRNSVAIVQGISQSVLKENEAKQVRSDIKNEFSKIYRDDYLYDGLIIKKNTVEYSEANVSTEVLSDSSFYSILDKLPMSFGGLRYVNKTFSLADYKIVDVAKSSDDWMFGGFASYQYLDKYFMGYDIGINSTYNRGGRYDFGMKIGYERLQNTNGPVLSDAKVGVWVPGPDDSSGAVNASIFNSTKNAGFELNDVLLSINSLMTEFTVSYNLWSSFSLSSGIGYKRLLSVTTRPISGLDSDALSDPNFEMNMLDNSEVLNSPSVNRNRFYMPIELLFTLKKKMTIGMGTQLSINRNFEKFDEKTMAIYTRASFGF